MRIDTSQQLRTSQQMKLAPRMIQSMEILQMPLLALQERIEKELESNIALETITERDDDELQESIEQDSESNLREKELIPGDARNFERLNEFEKSYGEETTNRVSESEYVPTQAVGDRDRKMDAMANTAAKGENLAEQLLHQWAFVDVGQSTAEVGKLIIQYIDDDGFLSVDLDTLLEQNKSIPNLEFTPELLEEALSELQSILEPAGIGARNQVECFLLQVDRLSTDPENEHDWINVVTLILHHYEDLLQNRLPKIEQKSGLSMEQIKEAMGLMKLLLLHPGRELVSDDVPPIIPDVIIEYEESSDTYVARLADGILPLLRISTQAQELSKDKTQEKETREFVNNGIRNATWLIDAIVQRKNTLLRVVNVVLSRQRDFFDYGSQHLKPLPMTEVADQLGVHVATVSRAVADKWLQAPRGMVPLRGFFSGGSTTDSGEEVSWQAVKAKLKEIIDAEDKKKPLSDEALSKELKNHGIDLARRTVVKYRSQLSIPPARLRKEH